MMNKLSYYLLYCISLLPMRVLYVISDFFAFLLYYIVGYRKKVVFNNLDIAFPEKTISEKKIIAKKFYQNFTDTLLETIKIMSAGEKLIDKMFVYDEASLDIMKQTSKPIQIHAMHNFNWEIVNLGFSRKATLPFIGVYQPITNPFFEKLFKKIRSQFGTILIPANDFKRNYIPFQDQQYIIALVADQNPGNPAKAYWAHFFGKLTPFVTGPEKAAKQKNALVVFGYFYKLKRGVYSFEVFKASEDPSSMKEGELTLQYIRFLEERIRSNPDNYLWSHRRWKHPFETAYEKLVIT